MFLMMLIIMKKRMIMMITIKMIQLHVDDQNDDYEQVRLAFRTLDKDSVFLMMLMIMKKRMIMVITIQMIQVDHVDNQNDNYEQVRLAFRTLDKDGSGTIETSEFKHLMTHIGNETEKIRTAMKMVMTRTKTKGSPK